jgi:tetratricopeptide (TPR) repeat protein
VEEAIRLDPEHAVARTIKASALLDAGRAHEAIRAADEALALDPDSPAAAEVKSKAKSRLRRRRN